MPTLFFPNIDFLISRNMLKNNLERGVVIRSISIFVHTKKTPLLKMLLEIVYPKFSKKINYTKSGVSHIFKESEDVVKKNFVHPCFSGLSTPLVFLHLIFNTIFQLSFGYVAELNTVNLIYNEFFVFILI